MIFAQGRAYLHACVRDRTYNQQSITAHQSTLPLRSLRSRMLRGARPPRSARHRFPPHPPSPICVSVMCVCRWVCIHRGCVSPSWVCQFIMPAPPVGVRPPRPVLGSLCSLRFKRERVGALPSLRLGVCSAPFRSWSGGLPSPRLGLATLAPL